MKRVTAPLPLIAVLVAAASAVALFAQQPAAPAAPQRGGGALGAQPPPGGTAPQLEALKMPKGFSVAIWADKVTGARSMTLGADGTVYVGTQRGDVYAVADRNRDNKADDVLTVASGLTQPNGVAFRDGSLYVAEISKISRYDGVDAFAKTGAGAPAPKPVVVYDQFPTDRQHGWKYLAFGPDGLLYTQVGAPGNIVERPDPYATILRMKPDGSGLEIFARGVRNSVGLAWHPDTRELWFTDNGRDMLGDEQPNDELNTAPKAGLHFGYPYCHEGTISDPEFGGQASVFGVCRTSGQARTTRRGARAEVLHGHPVPGGIPEAAVHREPRLVESQRQRLPHRLPPDDREAAGQQGRRATSRSSRAGCRTAASRGAAPVDLLVLPDGSMLVSDDRANVIYRITIRG